MSGAVLQRPHALLPSIIHGRRARVLLELAAVALGVTLVAALAKVSFFVGPVPITGQTLGVLLVGAALGANRAAVTMTTYMMVGLIGLPVFAGPTAGPASVLAPSFGFVIGFIPCAWLVGWCADRGWDRSVVKGVAVNTIASVIPFVIGVPYMVIVVSVASQAVPSFAQTMEWGVLPFIPGGIVKAVLAGCALSAAWAIHRRMVGTGQTDSRLR